MNICGRNSTGRVSAFQAERCGFEPHRPLHNLNSESVMGRKKKNKRKLEIAGKTEDGKPVIRGLYNLVATYGLPLPIAIQVMAEKGIIPDWIAFYKQAVKEGWHPDRVIIKLESAITDIFGSEWRDEWKIRMMTYVEGVRE